MPQDSSIEAGRPHKSISQKKSSNITHVSWTKLGTCSVPAPMMSFTRSSQLDTLISWEKKCFLLGSGQYLPFLPPCWKFTVATDVSNRFRNPGCPLRRNQKVYAFGGLPYRAEGQSPLSQWDTESPPFVVWGILGFLWQMECPVWGWFSQRQGWVWSLSSVMPWMPILGGLHVLDQALSTAKRCK
jgi:hypothetical protein